MPHLRRRMAAVATWVLFAACTVAQPTPSALPSQTAEATATTSPSAEPTAAPPTPTPVATATPTPMATATPAPTPTPTLMPSPTPTPYRPPSGDLRVERTLSYATSGECGARLTKCQQFVDVYAPVEPGPWPVAVMIHGRPRTPADMAELARAVARLGAVVYNADYRGVRPVGLGWPFAIEDVACAVRYARATAVQYGGDAGRLVLVGHSFGGYVGTLVALAGDEFGGTCLYPNESALPSAWVGVGGNYVIGDPPHELWSVFFGGSADELPAAWAKGNTLQHIGGNPALVVRLLHMSEDEVLPPSQGRRLVRALTNAGYDAQMTVIEGEGHWALLDVDGFGALTVGVVAQLLGIPPTAATERGALD